MTNENIEGLAVRAALEKFASDYEIDDLYERDFDRYIKEYFRRKEQLMSEVEE